MLLRGGVAEIIAARARAVVAEPDGAIRFHHDVVWTGEFFAFETLRQHGDRAVIFRAGEVLRIVLAAHQPALAIARVAIRIVRRFAKDADPAGGFIPSQDSVVGYVAEQQIPPIAEPNRPFGETKPGGDALDRRRCPVPDRESDDPRQRCSGQDNERARTTPSETDRRPCGGSFPRFSLPERIITGGGRREPNPPRPAGPRPPRAPPR